MELAEATQKVKDAERKIQVAKSSLGACLEEEINKQELAVTDAENALGLAKADVESAEQKEEEAKRNVKKETKSYDEKSEEVESARKKLEDNEDDAALREKYEDEYYDAREAQDAQDGFLRDAEAEFLAAEGKIKAAEKKVQEAKLFLEKKKKTG